MKVNTMDTFMRRSTSHDAQCGSPLALIQRQVYFCGFMLHEIWKCPCCVKELVFDNQDIIRLDEVVEGAFFSCLQPKINLKIVKGSKLEGILHEQMLRLFRCMGIYVGKYANVLKRSTKVEAV